MILSWLQISMAFVLWNLVWYVVCFVCLLTGSVFQVQIHNCWAGSSVQPVRQRGRGVWGLQRGGWGGGGRGERSVSRTTEDQSTRCWDETILLDTKCAAEETTCMLFVSPGDGGGGQRCRHRLLFWWRGRSPAKEEESLCSLEVCVYIVCVLLI